MSNELEKIQNKLKDDPSMKELREWLRMTKKMMSVIRRWPGNSTYKLDEGLQAFVSIVDALVADADDFEKRTGKTADNPEEEISG